MLGEYVTRDCTATVYLRRVKRVVEKYCGAPAPEDTIARLVIETMVHEELHFLVRSGSPNEDTRIAREHRTIARVLSAAGYDYTY